jgi:hypothetical protein
MPYASPEPGAHSAPIKAVGQHSLRHSALTKMHGSYLKLYPPLRHGVRTALRSIRISHPSQPVYRLVIC